MRGKQARIMAWLLSVALLSGSLSMPAYAADAGTAPETTQTQTEEPL